MDEEVPGASDASEVVRAPLSAEVQALEELRDAVEAWVAEGADAEPPGVVEVDEADLQLLLDALVRGRFPNERTRALAERLVEADDESVWSALREAREFDSAVLWDEDVREGVMHELGLDEDDFDVDGAVDNELDCRLDELYAAAAARTNDVVRTRRAVLHSQPRRPPTRVHDRVGAAPRRAPRARRARASSRAGPSDDGSSDDADAAPSQGASESCSSREADERAQAGEPVAAGVVASAARADGAGAPEFGFPVHPTLALFPRAANPVFHGLAASIRERGLHDPVTVFNGVLVDGRERLQACRAAGVEPVVCEWSGDGDVEEWILDRHLRRDLSASQRAALAVLWDGREELELAAQDRARRGTRAPDGAGVGRTSAELARRFGASARQVERALRLAHASPQLLRRTRDGVFTLNQAESQLELEQARAAVSAFDGQLPAGLFSLVMVDPPWPEQGVPYPTMSLEQIRALELPLAEDAVVLLWTTQRFLPLSFDVLRAWQLRYLRTKMWAKPGRGAHSGSEFLLLAARGEPPITISLDDLISGPVRRHSEKPEQAYGMADELLPNARRLDMFGRKSRPGWTTWGAEATKFDPPTEDAPTTAGAGAEP